MKKVTLLLATCGFLMLTSCSKKTDELTITFNNAGTLTFNVVNENQPLMDAKVKLYYYSNGSISSNSVIATEGVTNASGKFKTDKLLEGHYNCSVSYTKNGVTYSDSKFAQVIAGNDKTIVLEPLTNVGKLSVKVVSYSNTPQVGVNVAITPYVSYTSVWDNVSNAIFVAKTDASGVATFNGVPCGTSYYVTAYNDSKTRYDYIYGIYPNKEKETAVSLSYY